VEAKQPETDGFHDQPDHYGELKVWEYDSGYVEIESEQESSKAGDGENGKLAQPNPAPTQGITPSKTRKKPSQTSSSKGFHGYFRTILFPDHAISRS
jgi:hypothetical protein